MAKIPLPSHRPKEGVETILDFTAAGGNLDAIALTDGLTFAQLTITQASGASASDTLIRIADSHELLAILTGVQSSSVISAHFTAF